MPPSIASPELEPRAPARRVVFGKAGRRVQDLTGAPVRRCNVPAPIESEIIAKRRIAEALAAREKAWVVGFDNRREVKERDLPAVAAKAAGRANVNVRESGLTFLHDRGTISTSMAAAGLVFRRHCEALGGSQMSGVGIARASTPGNPERMTERSWRAAKTLAAARRRLMRSNPKQGEFRFRLCRLICGDGMTLREAAAALGYKASGHQRSHLSKELVLGLTDLAMLWGMVE